MYSSGQVQLSFLARWVPQYCPSLAHHKLINQELGKRYKLIIHPLPILHQEQGCHISFEVTRQYLPQIDGACRCLSLSLSKGRAKPKYLGQNISSQKGRPSQHISQGSIVIKTILILFHSIYLFIFLIDLGKSYHGGSFPLFIQKEERVGDPK